MLSWSRKRCTSLWSYEQLSFGLKMTNCALANYVRVKVCQSHFSWALWLHEYCTLLYFSTVITVPSTRSGASGSSQHHQVSEDHQVSADSSSVFVFSTGAICPPLLSTATPKEGLIHLLSLETGQPAYLPVWVASCLPLWSPALCNHDLQPPQLLLQSVGLLDKIQEIYSKIRLKPVWWLRHNLLYHKKNSDVVYWLKLYRVVDS